MIGFVLLNYLAYKETLSCVESISRLEGEKVIAIVDNCSPNESYQTLCAAYAGMPGIHVLQSGGNLGFAVGNNVGYAFLREHYTCDFIVVMNSDMEITDTLFLKKIEEIYRETPFDVLGPDIYSTRDHRHQNPEAKKNYTYRELKKIRRRLTFKNALPFAFYLKWWLRGRQKKKAAEPKPDSDYRNPAEQVILHGSCYIFSAPFIKKEAHCFYEKTFMYFESYILAYQCGIKGYVMRYSPKLGLLHHEDVSTDMAYKKAYKKSVFTVKCLRQSCNVFIQLMKADRKEKRKHVASHE